MSKNADFVPFFIKKYLKIVTYLIFDNYFYISNLLLIYFLVIINFIFTNYFYSFFNLNQNIIFIFTLFLYNFNQYLKIKLLINCIHIILIKFFC